MLSRTNRRTGSKVVRAFVPPRSVHPYGRHPAQVGELFEPEDRPLGVAVVLHGGFWRARYDRQLMDELCVDLAANGWLAWNLEYRRVGDGGGWPETLDDVSAGIDHLATLDPSRGLTPGPVPFVAVGHSAGGQLALWAAARPNPRVPITHAVSQAGVLDLHEADRLGLSDHAARELLRSTPDEEPERWRLASPLKLLPLGVPQLVVHGEKDDVVPASISAEYVQAARAAGDPCLASLLPGVGHYEHLDPSSDAWAAVRDFLESLAG